MAAIDTITNYLFRKKMITKLCLLNGADVNELHNMGVAARNMAKYIAHFPKGDVISLSDQQISTAFLDRVAEHLHRYELMFLDGGQMFTKEEIKVPFMNSLSAAERESFSTCVRILVGQGRLELCVPFNADGDTPEKSADEVVDNKRWVYYTFIERVQTELDKIVVDLTGLKLSEATLFSDEFLQSLTQDEREMLMPCTLKLVMAGGIKFPVFELEDDEEDPAAAVAA
jgi:hypothetical protein